MQHQVYFTPGPSQLYYTVNDHLKSAIKENVGSISHRSVAFQKIYAETVENLKTLLNLPDGYELYFTSSANEIWERIIQNLVSEKSHHFVNGTFAKKFYQFAQQYQKQASITANDDGVPFDNYEIPEHTELISITLNETSIGFQFDQNMLKQIRLDHPEALISVDGVSAFPAISFDFSLADTAYFSVQKCFGLPAGLGVWIVNQRAMEKAKKLEESKHITGSYHRLSQLQKQGAQNQTPETPNMLGIYLLGKIAADLNFRGAKQIQNDTIYKSTILYQALEQSSQFTPFVNSNSNRSKTVIVAACEKSNSAFLENTSKKGWIIGKGYGEYKNEHIRIANFPVHSKEQSEQLADYISKL